MKELRIKHKNDIVIVLVDDNDFDAVSQYKWHICNGYVARREYYGRRDPTTKRYPSRYLKLHRVLMGVADPKIQVDHKDMNPLNNQRSNLRICSNRENGYNKTKIKRNTSGYKNVSFSKPVQKWRSYLTYKGKTHSLGYFDTPEQAHEAYIRKAKELHGEFYCDR